MVSKKRAEKTPPVSHVPPQEDIEDVRRCSLLLSKWHELGLISAREALGLTCLRSLLWSHPIGTTASWFRVALLHALVWHSETLMQAGAALSDDGAEFANRLRACGNDVLGTVEAHARKALGESPKQAFERAVKLISEGKASPNLKGTALYLLFVIVVVRPTAPNEWARVTERIRKMSGARSDKEGAELALSAIALNRDRHGNIKEGAWGVFKQREDGLHIRDRRLRQLVMRVAKAARPGEGKRLRIRTDEGLSNSEECEFQDHSLRDPLDAAACAELLRNAQAIVEEFAQEKKSAAYSAVLKQLSAMADGLPREAAAEREGVNLSNFCKALKAVQAVIRQRMERLAE